MDELHTRKIDRGDSGGDAGAFFARYRAVLVLLTGPAAGTEYPLERPPITIGRGPEAEIHLDEPSLSRAHATLELVETGFRIRDLGSTNGVELNGKSIQAAELKHGDRLRLGQSTFQLLLEERTTPLRTYVLPDA